MTERPQVSEYMTREVKTVSPTDTVAAVARRIKETEGHNGFPVSEGRKVQGFVTASDLLLAGDDDPLFTVMTEDIIVGIISNTDVVRSQIERATPEKVGKLMRTLEQIHDVSLHQEHRHIELARLTPTQGRVYADELEGRQYELERGLAEPLVVIDNAGELVLADGHHRVMAATELGIEAMDASTIVIGNHIQLGMQRTAEKEGLASIDDIEIVDYGRHPLVESTERLQE